MRPGKERSDIVALAAVPLDVREKLRFSVRPPILFAAPPLVGGVASTNF
jgi:hypothetical protein